MCAHVKWKRTKNRNLRLRRTKNLLIYNFRIYFLIFAPKMCVNVLYESHLWMYCSCTCSIVVAMRVYIQTVALLTHHIIFSILCQLIGVFLRGPTGICFMTKRRSSNCIICDYYYFSHAIWTTMQNLHWRICADKEEKTHQIAIVGDLGAIYGHHLICTIYLYLYVHICFGSGGEPNMEIYIQTKREFMHISFPLRHIQFLLFIIMCFAYRRLLSSHKNTFINTIYTCERSRLTQLFLLRSVYFLENPFFFFLASFCIMFCSWHWHWHWPWVLDIQYMSHVMLWVWSVFFSLFFSIMHANKMLWRRCSFGCRCCCLWLDRWQ